MGKISEALGFSRAADRTRGAKSLTAPILLYHRFAPRKPHGKWTVTTPIFEEQVQWLRAHHYRVVPLRQVVDGIRKGGKNPKTDVAITVDDGDRSVFTEMFPVLQRYGAPATLFVYPKAISHAPEALTWEELRIMVASGLIDVQFHTVSHPHFHREKRRLAPADYDALVAYELGGTRQTIADRLGVTVDMLAWPFGVYDAGLKEAAAKAGFSVAFAVTRNSRRENSEFAIPRILVHNRHRGDRLGARLVPGAGSYMRLAHAFALSGWGFAIVGLSLSAGLIGLHGLFGL